MSKRKKRKLATDRCPANVLLREHLQALRLRNEDAYKQWCADRGFRRTIHKPWTQLEKERLIVTRELATASLKREKKQRRTTSDIIAQIFRGQVRDQDVDQPHLRAICRAYESTKKDRLTKNTTLRLLQHVEPLTDFMTAPRSVPGGGVDIMASYVHALINVARSRYGWVRPVEDWRPRTHNTARQFSSLVRHLFAKYPIPKFMDSVWFDLDGDLEDNRASRTQTWFKHIGQGHNIRTASLPIPYTKRMAHHFLTAPDDYSAHAALRWGQIHALGGNARVANAIRPTRIGQAFENDDFWITVIRFFIAHPMLDTVHYGPIIDFLQHQRFEATQEFVAPGVIQRQPPPQANLSMKGRDPLALLRQVERWHRQLAHEFNDSSLDWPRTDIPEFTFIEGRKGTESLKRWTIRELLTTKALVTEGRKMKHCVASYAHSCAKRRTSIWAMELETFLSKKKVLTVEVDPRYKVICQARGKHNASPDENARAILRRWATEAGLRAVQLC